MPAYNASKTIRDAIRSVQAQSYTDWELLITNDCSTDGTAELVQQASEDDPRIQLFEHETNKRAWGARNTSIAAATGRYLAFLDSDDLWKPNKIQRSLDFMCSKDCSFCFTAFSRFSEDTESIESEVTVPSSVGYWSLLADNVIATSTVLIDRHEHPNVVMPESYYDDFACWLSILKDGHKAYGLNEPLMHYRKTQGSLSRNKIKSAKMVWYALRHEQNLNLLAASYYFSRYSANGILKHYLTDIYKLKHNT